MWQHRRPLVLHHTHFVLAVIITVVVSIVELNCYIIITDCCSLEDNSREERILYTPYSFIHNKAHLISSRFPSCPNSTLMLKMIVGASIQTMLGALATCREISPNLDDITGMVVDYNNAEVVGRFQPQIIP